MKRFNPALKYIGTGDYIEDMKEDNQGDYILFSEISRIKIQAIKDMLEADLDGCSDGWLHGIYIGAIESYISELEDIK